MEHPIIIPPTTDTTEARLMALERQRDVDHKYMIEVATALGNAQRDIAEQGANLQSLTQSGLMLRQEIFTARSELAAGVAGANDAAQSAAIAQMAVTVENKFAELDRLTNTLAISIEAIGIREQRVEQVVEQQAAGRPVQEGIITDAFNLWTPRFPGWHHWRRALMARRSRRAGTTRCPSRWR